MITKFCNRRQKIPDAHFYTSGIFMDGLKGDDLSSIRSFLLSMGVNGRKWAFPPSDRFFCQWVLMGLSGLEPPTSRLSGVRSNRLSYKPMCIISNTLHILQYFPPFVKYKLSLLFASLFLPIPLLLGSLALFFSLRPKTTCFYAVSSSLFLPIRCCLGLSRIFPL